VAGDIRITWNRAALDSLFSSLDSPVARMLMELSEEAATVARAAVHVRTLNPRDRRRRAGRNSSAQVPGFTKASIRTHLGRSALTGDLSGGVNAAGNAGIFLEYPASQMDRQYPFLTTALDALQARF
jgi:hypothetical protein